MFDDLENPINFNNQHWNITLKFTLIKDMDRFMYKNNFENILGSSNYDNYEMNQKQNKYDSLTQYQNIIHNETKNKKHHEE